ncbi:PTS galactosamine/N-acetylgalactosamine transporter subunit IIA [Halanaerobium salsuginis]|uniref:PTS system, N-acetylgalactosamine-specific IIA component n=1 Tax=Halanaerobium salsuginis TaxID=29563 RepID=A0A1I4FKU0_9FIRM|nr:PTS galactosamine/N-acetylgalactosamine transporter subunit IIA [Halanaerobium salsuginis]SFL18063.1 PTS system, N-acetylgalactosamine-specific IIA component [Halanaerobium salsuginis]
MTGIIISGHGHFAAGINSVIELVVGKQDKIGVVNFLESDSTDLLYKKLTSQVKELDCDSYLIFTDLPGGSPFKESVKLSLEIENCEVITGTNVPMILEIIFKLEDLSLTDLKNQALKIGKKQILAFEVKENTNKAENKIKDGI